MKIMVVAKEFSARAIYNEEGYVSIFFLNYGKVQTLPVDAFIREYKYSNGKEIKHEGLKGYCTINVQRKQSEMMVAEFEGIQWRVRSKDGFSSVLGLEVFPLMYKVMSGVMVIPQELKKCTGSKLAVTYITKKGIYRDPINRVEHGGLVHYLVGDLRAVTKKAGSEYKNDWTMAKGIMKVLEELAWDKSVQVVSFERL